VRSVEELVDAALVEAGVSAGTAVLVAISGGPDSTCLLHAIARISDTWRIVLAACVVDHGIRDPGEIDNEVAFVRRLCDRLGVPLTVSRIPPGQCVARAREQKRSLEETAREWRHRLLQEAAVEMQAQAIALGHTQDDVLETLLMRVIQGSDAEGLAGMPLRRGPFVRPLLRCTREQAREYLRERNLSWRDDPSNVDPRFLRNRVRSLLMPVLERDFPGYRTGMLTLARKLGSAAEVIRAEAGKLSWIAADGGYTIDGKAFFSVAPAVRASSLLRLYDTFRRSDSPRRLPWRFLSPALRVQGELALGPVIKGYGVVLEASGERLFWGPDLARRSKKGYFIEVSGAGYITLPETGMRLTFVHCTQNAGEGEGGVSLLSKEVQPPVFVRSKRMGDEILLERGMTSVKDLLAGWKVPVGDREKVPVLADRKGVLVVLGGALGYRTRARAGALAERSGGVDRIDVDFVKDMEEAREQQQR
jgi:tRNA(Ile)-lysidine synthase